MKISIVTDTDPGQMNGVAVSVGRLSSELSAMGHEVQVVDLEGVTCIPAGRFSPGLSIATPLSAWSVVKDKVEEFEPEHVHVATEGMVGLCGLKLAKQKGLTTSSCSHTDWDSILGKMFPPVGGLFGRWLSRRTTGVDIRFFRNSLEASAWSAKGKRSAVLRGGVDDCFRYGDQDLDGDILFAGRLSPEKGLDHLRVLADAGLLVSIAGSGPMERHMMLKHENIRMLGRLDKFSLADQMRKHRCLAFPSMSDTLGLVCLEAACCGLPSVGFKNKATDESIVHGVTGFCGTELHRSVMLAMRLDRAKCSRFALNMWGPGAMGESFISGLRSAGILDGRMVKSGV